MPLATTLVIAAGCVDPTPAVVHPVDDRPVVAVTSGGDAIVLGGFSGLAFLGVDEATGALRFATHTDRGPNAELVGAAGGAGRARPFVLPTFQPELVMIDVDPGTGRARIVRRIGLVAPDGTALSGLPPAPIDQPDREAPPVELAIDLLGASIRGDERGVDLEGLARAGDGSWWMCEEYRPSILRFDETGTLMERWAPRTSSAASAAALDVPAIPAIYAHRVPNRGFEGIALVGTRLHAFLQGPLAPPDAPDRTLRKAIERSRAIRVPVFDIEARTLVAEHVYLLESPKHKLGDAAAGPGGEVLVLEAGGGSSGGAAAHVYRVDASDATDLLTLSPETIAAIEPIEARTPDELAAAGIVPLRKTLVIDCGAAGYDFARKPEGLAAIDSRRLAIVNDDDFGLSGAFDAATGRLVPNAAPQPVAIAIFEVSR